VDESGCHFDLCFFPPSSGHNPDLAKLYEGNFFQVLRDEDPSGGFKYSLSNENSLDMAIFLNGLPLFTAEIKNAVSGQNVAHAIAQYERDRDPKEPLFRFARCLAHFPIDTEQVFMTPMLEGKRTRFFPFNQGNDHGAGNPPSSTGISTAYLWREIWTKESILDLIRRFVQVVDQHDDKGRPTGKKIQIFPRYHQLGCVREQTGHAKVNGPGFSYLNQHSAGSGKTIEIATLANSLATLHDDSGKAVFNTVIVLSDRQVIDAQLQKELAQFTQTQGMLENIDQTSRQLKAALEDGKKIIVSTIQKFSVIVDELVSLKSNTFAVIIDEAHSSQAGVTGGNVNRVVSYGDLTLEGKAKAMIVTRSRLHAVRYAVAVREYLKELGEVIPPWMPPPVDPPSLWIHRRPTARRTRSSTFAASSRARSAPCANT
jgi:type I restriction enzyme R subunit